MDAETSVMRSFMDHIAVDHIASLFIGKLKPAGSAILGPFSSTSVNKNAPAIILFEEKSLGAGIVPVNIHAIVTPCDIDLGLRGKRSFAFMWPSPGCLNWAWKKN
jgi:hypothetical protein